MTEYAWIIEKDHLEEDVSKSEVGIAGPREISDLQLQILKDGVKGQTFRMYDDDDILYYEGRFIGPRELGDEPLYDFGMPNAGCTRIEYS